MNNSHPRTNVMHSNAGPSQHTNADPMNDIDNAGVLSDSHIDRTPIYSDTTNPNPKAKPKPETRGEMNGNANARENAKEKGKAEAEGDGTKTPFFDKQTGGWREVEVVDLCDD